MLQLHLSDRKFYCLLRYVLYLRFDGNNIDLYYLLDADDHILLELESENFVFIQRSKCETDIALISFNEAHFKLTSVTEMPHAVCSAANELYHG